jgi:hypothetical protein
MVTRRLLQPLLALALAATLLPLLVGCEQKPEQIARDAITASASVLRSAQTKFADTCRVNSAQEPCVRITEAVVAQNVAVDALELYCSGGDFQHGGKCTPNQEVVPKLKQALETLDRSVSYVKLLNKGR